jgi:hypothetical protein
MFLSEFLFIVDDKLHFHLEKNTHKMTTNLTCQNEVREEKGKIG